MIDESSDSHILSQRDLEVPLDSIKRKSKSQIRKDLERDSDLGIIPDLTKNPVLLNQTIDQLNRGEIRDVTQSDNPQIQGMVSNMWERQGIKVINGDTLVASRGPKFITRVINYVRSRIRR